MAQLQVFVYGSLKRGHYNHGLLRASSFLGCWRTPARYTLLDLGAFPGIVAGGGTAISGEVYGIDRGTLRALDRLEGHPDFYRRETITTPFGEAGIYVLAGRPTHGVIIASGCWPAAAGAVE